MYYQCIQIHSHHIWALELHPDRHRHLWLHHTPQTLPEHCSYMLMAKWIKTLFMVDCINALFIRTLASLIREVEVARCTVAALIIHVTTNILYTAACSSRLNMVQHNHINTFEFSILRVPCCIRPHHQEFHQCSSHKEHSLDLFPNSHPYTHHKAALSLQVDKYTYQTVNHSLLLNL